MSNSKRGLADRIVRFMDGETEMATDIPNLTVYHFDAPTQPTSYLLEPSFCVILQGAKYVVLGDEDYHCDADHFLVTSVDLPVIAQILQADPSEPYVGLVLKLDRNSITELILDDQVPPASDQNGRGIAVGTLTPALFGAVARLIDLLDEPENIPALAPLIQKEILFRLLATECGSKIKEIASAGSRAHYIARIVEWMRDNPSEPLRVDELAHRAGMSESSLYHHFRSLTAMSPLQFQKRLRLNEARRLMLTDRIVAATAAYRVGYESPSQFSREYSRLFGAPPLRDVKRLSEAAVDRV